MDWSNKTVLITGGTGSFGRKFAEIVLKHKKPKKLIIFSRDELKQHEMRQDFPDGENSPVRYFIGDVRDKERLYRAFNDVDVVVHAAALKQVPACEYNPFEAVQTNIIGAKNVLDAAIDKGVDKAIALSTDKAVNPINLYGATKLCAEKMFIQSNTYAGGSGPKFAVCRYGNVVGSRGSVIPLFQKQRMTGKVSITDKRMTRFWITLDQGVDFVLKCIEGMYGGEIFVPKIPSMGVEDLATAIAPKAEKQYVGIRPGEKLHEVLIAQEESQNVLELENMYIIQPTHSWWKIENWPGAKPVPNEFRYGSENNPVWMSTPEIENLAKDIS